jgi:hypothetical protein
MNPQIAWEQMLRAYASGDWDAIEQRATELLAWLDRDGVPPTIVKHPGIGPEWNAALARTACLLALDDVQSRWSVPA